MAKQLHSGAGSAAASPPLRRARVLAGTARRPSRRPQSGFDACRNVGSPYPRCMTPWVLVLSRAHSSSRSITAADITNSRAFVMTTPLDTLDSDIDKRFEGKDSDNQGGFIPVTALSALLTKTSVKAVLLDSDTHKLPIPERTTRDAYIDDLTSFVVDQAPQIFAILIRVEVPWHIQRFYSRRLGQSILPIMQENGQVRPIGRHYLDAQEKEGLEYIFAIDGGRSGWSAAKIRNFCNYQWGFLSPILEYGVFKREVPSKAPMPYTNFSPLLGSQDSFLRKDGSIEHGNTNPGHGGVGRGCIHRDHLKRVPERATCLDSNGNYRVALKFLKTTKMQPDEIEHEITTLKSISDSKRFKSKHIIRAMCSVTQGGQPSIVFPWAERGSLHHFWRDEDQKIKPDNPQFSEFLSCVLAQLSGLAGAVAEMHKFNIRHGDIKPSNILCFKESDGNGHSIMPVRMVVTDVGTAKDHLSSTTKRRMMNTITKVNTSTARYAAPELQDVLNRDHESGVLSRKFDVWSLGCVYMEFLIWLLYGQEGQIQFLKESDTFFETGTSEETAAKVISADGKRWLAHMSDNDGRCSANTALGALLALIKDKLLVIHVRELHEGREKPSPQPPKEPTVEPVSRKPGSFFARLRPGRKNKKKSQPVNTPPTKTMDAVTTETGVVKYRISAGDTQRELHGIMESLQDGRIRATVESGEVRGCASRPPPKPKAGKSGGAKTGN
ncbi:hypothetical protein B0T14DRAFT_603013, partial [Immersiella caudata]